MPGGRYVAGLRAGAAPQGWVRSRLSSRARRPRKSTPEWVEFDALEFRWPPVPGLASEYYRDHGDGTGVVMRPMLRVHDGCVWFGLPQMPTDGVIGEEWVEVRSSDFGAASAAWFEALRAEERS